jgi:hypothetical protein
MTASHPNILTMTLNNCNVSDGPYRLSKLGLKPWEICSEMRHGKYFRSEEKKSRDKDTR